MPPNSNTSARDTYEQPQQFETHLGGQDISFVSKLGLPNWDQVTPSARLLAENTTIQPNERLFLLGCGHGATAAALAQQAPKGALWLTDTNSIALQMAALTLKINQVSNAKIHPLTGFKPEQKGAFDAAVMDLPKGRALARRWLVEAHTVLRAGGHLYLAGANNMGIKPIVRDAEALFGEADVLAYKKGNRVVRLRKSHPQTSAPDWSLEPGIAPDTWIEIRIQTPQGEYQMHSLPGVFSANKLDEGTEFLLNHIEVSPSERVLDLGCGYGIIGLVAAQAGAGFVDLIDVNLLAVVVAQKNLAYHGIQNASAFPSDGLSAVKDKQYDQIITNPPFHSGRAVDYQITDAFIKQSQQALKPGGKLTLVANKFIRYEQQLKKEFKTVHRAAETSRYHILIATQ